MKLRNKKNGKIVEVLTDSIAVNVLQDREDITGYYTSLAELNDEWEDVQEEPKEYWFMDYGGRIKAINDSNDEEDVARKEIGNYFDTREEAEKAVEKLKAWKRLKDKGFKFDNFVRDAIYFNLDEEQIQNKSILKDLGLLFGGEE